MDEEEVEKSFMNIDDEEPLEELEGNINDFRFDEDTDDDPDKDH